MIQSCFTHWIEMNTKMFDSSQKSQFWIYIAHQKYQRTDQGICQKKEAIGSHDLAFVRIHCICAWERDALSTWTHRHRSCARQAVRIQRRNLILPTVQAAILCFCGYSKQICTGTCVGKQEKNGDPSWHLCNSITILGCVDF